MTVERRLLPEKSMNYMRPQSPVERRFVRLAHGYNRRARAAGVEGIVTAMDLAVIFERDGGDCAYCGVGLHPMHCSFDHVIAIDSGGNNHISDIVICCIDCQRTKFTKTAEELHAYRVLQVTCPVDGVVFKPRWNDWKRGAGRVCSRRCAGAHGAATAGRGRPKAPA